MMRVGAAAVLLLAACVWADTDVISVAGGFDGSSGTASALDVRGIAFGNDGIFFTDFEAHRVRRWNYKGGSTENIVGSVPGGRTSAPQLLDRPWGIVKDANSPLFREVFWLAASGGDQIGDELEKPALKILQVSDDILLVDNVELPLNFDPTAGIALPNGDVAFVSNGNSNVRVATFNRETNGPVLTIASDEVGVESFLAGIAYNPAAEEFYVADERQHVIYALGLNGSFRTVAGDYGMPGHTIDNLNAPRGLAYDNDTDTLYICDSGNNYVRTIDPTAIIRGTANPIIDLIDMDFYEPSAISLVYEDDEPILYIGSTESRDFRGSLVRIGADSSAVSDGEILVGVNPNMYDDIGLEARFGFPSGMEFERGSSGRLWIGDDGALRVLDPKTGIVSTGAGQGPRPSFSTDGDLAGPGTIGRVTDIAFSRDNQIVYFSEVNDEIGQSRVREVRFDDASRTDGSVRTLVDFQFNVRGIALDLDNSILYFSDAADRKIWSFFLATGELELLAGSGENRDRDDIGDRASFRQPWGIDLDAANGILYVADRGANKIRAIDVDTKTVTTLAGSGIADSVDGPLRESGFNAPSDVALSPLGILWAADTESGLLRSIDAEAGVVTTVAGSELGERDGPLLRARMNRPLGIAVDVARGATPVYMSSLEGRVIYQIGTVDVCEDMDCSDRNSCTTEGCNSGLGTDACFTAFNTDRCDDGNVCTVGDRCDGAGNCIPGEAANEGAICFTGDLCFEDQRCNDNGECIGFPVTCDDENACTIDQCFPLIGCTHEQRVCNDNNECTDDVCISDIGCTFQPNDAFCDADANPCTTDQCSAGACAVVSDTDCDDGNPCNDDFCDPILGCMSTREAECSGKNFRQDTASCTCECLVEQAQIGCAEPIDELQCLCVERPQAQFVSIRVEYVNDVRRAAPRMVEEVEMLLEVFAAETLTFDDVEVRNELAGELGVDEELLFLVGGANAANGNRAIVLDVYGQEQLPPRSLLSILASASGCSTIDPSCTVAANSTVGALGIVRISTVRGAAPPPVEGIGEEGGGGEAYVDPIDNAPVPLFAPFTDTVPYSANTVPSEPRIVYFTVSSGALLSCSAALSVLVAFLLAL